MKTIIKSSAPNTLEAVMIKPQSNLLPFGSGYLNFLTRVASTDEDEPARAGAQQPVRYLAAVEPMADADSKIWEAVERGVGQAIGRGLNAAIREAARPSVATPTLREAVDALRQRILAS